MSLGLASDRRCPTVTPPDPPLLLFPSLSAAVVDPLHVIEGISLEGLRQTLLG